MRMDEAPKDNASRSAKGSEPIVRLRNVVKRFGDQTVLSGVNLDVYPGDRKSVV